MNTASKDKSVLLQRIKSRLLQIATKDGDFMTAFPGLSIHRRSSVTDSIPCIYDLGLAITISGRKQVIAGKDVYEYQAGEALLASVDMPVMSRVLQASNSDPFLGIMLRLDTRLVLQVAAGLVIPQVSKQISATALTKGTLNLSLLGALDRLLSLSDEQYLLSTLSPLIIQEIIARILVSEFGSVYMKLNTSASPSRQIAQAMGWLKQHFSESITIESLADQAHMSQSSFRQHFKTVAGISPLQYLKQLRLQEARQLMLNDGLDAGASGLSVGYESVSQFSREYARLFGVPPSKDIKQLRSQM
ncbi:MAG: AraC family transcriptional regulator [Gammaproteobacteria bacterium]|nr:AraC family transcriptional regulator [Gammaproteobacteria bacterium]HBF07742.1 AraC family transcriptional regulator [Gammaproteobacteria bacterium]|tara:strand:- start:99 stop:1007 length:909 start_codon:yes stop_codon:yes gene_type:complete